MRITWLLLSISCVCSHVDSQTVTSVTKNGAVITSGPPAVSTSGSASKTEPTTDIYTTVTFVIMTKTSPTSDPGNKNVPQALTSANPNAAANTPSIAVTATSQPTDQPNPTQPQVPTVTKSPPSAPSTIISVAQTTVRNDATPSAATPGLSKATTPAVTADSSTGSVGSPSAATMQTPAAPVPSKTSGTEAPVRLPGDVGTTKTTKGSTEASVSGQQSPTHTTSKAVEGTKATTVMVTSYKQTASRTPEPAGNTGTTSILSTSSKTGPPAADTFGAGTMFPQTSTTTIITTSTAAQPKTFLYSLNKGHEDKDKKDLVEVCRRLMVNLQDGNCTLTWQHLNGKVQFDCVEINGKVKTSLATQYYEEITKKPTDNRTLIAILASCGALLIMIVILAVCATQRRKPFNENQQHLTEELHTVENGYHDNPTLEVMEVQPEMQEKKTALNGEFSDSWIVPIDNLLKEDIADEEDTHL